MNKQCLDAPVGNPEKGVGNHLLDCLQVVGMKGNRNWWDYRGLSSICIGWVKAPVSEMGIHMQCYHWLSETASGACFTDSNFIVT